MALAAQGLPSGVPALLGKGDLAIEKGKASKGQGSIISLPFGIDGIGGHDMPLHRLVHIDDVPPENTNPQEGWAMTEFRVPISGRDGSSTTVFHTRLASDASHKKHYHTGCDDIIYYLRGIGLAGAGKSRIEMREG